MDDKTGQTIQDALSERQIELMLYYAGEGPRPLDATQADLDRLYELGLLESKETVH